ncbi:type III secretion inner membrane ring lipoprotein SctJ [Sphingomonas sp. H39-1-10]|uniref:type III secretion system inner membrane ring lipoprotein SctJ n=1 Tax=Sphingomonas pollutisoli TaxID=3030829 RepID=UPI0023B9F360|nr:type III secretion inner membrane ring lipoprotein SctJ [Sphingomonas pollutisoli]MDF0490009.1 type III secretion inner membrane ring lipoprotein SctJ [Sphingomonas pollutisoli]
MTDALTACRRWVVFALMPLLLLSACGKQEVYGKLKEAEANEMIAVLRTADVDASKTSGADGNWSVAVAPDQFSRAVQVLRSNGLPRDSFATLGTVFEKKGFVSSPVEERARLIYGLSQELSHTVSEIDGVVEARVHLAIPQPDPLSETMKPSSAAVFIKYQPGFDVRSQTGAIKALVTNSIEGLSYDKVSVVMVPSQIAAPAPAISMQTIDTPVVRLGLIAAALLAAAAALFWPRRRRAASTSLPVPAE